MAGDPGGQGGLQVGNDAGNHGAGRLGGAQNAYIVLSGHGHHFRMGRDAPGDDQGGKFIREQPVKNGAAVSWGQLGDVAHFHVAHYLKAHGFVVVEEACQLKARTGHIFHGDPDGGKVRGGIDHLQMKFLHQLAKGDAVCISHGCHLVGRKVYTKIIIPGPEGNINRFSKNKNFLKKPLAFLRILWYHI